MVVAFRPAPAYSGITLTPLGNAIQTLVHASLHTLIMQFTNISIIRAASSEM